MNHTCLCLPSQSWYWFADPRGMEGWVGLGLWLLVGSTAVCGIAHLSLSQIDQWNCQVIYSMTDTVCVCRRLNSGASRAKVRSWTAQSRTSGQNYRSWSRQQSSWMLWTFRRRHHRSLNRWRCKVVLIHCDVLLQLCHDVSDSFWNVPHWRTSCSSSVRLLSWLQDSMVRPAGNVDQ